MNKDLFLCDFPTVLVRALVLVLAVYFESSACELCCST